jgi:hypothetical protein
MKRLSLFLTLIALTLPQTGQAGWWRTYNASNWDEGRCVQEVADGFIITGYTLLYDTWGALLWLIKTDASGNLVWDKTFGKPTASGSIGNFIQKTTDGGYIITGQLGGEGKSDIWLLKTNVEGDTIWTKTFGETSGYCVQQTHDDGYIITGSKGWSTDARLFLLKTNSMGDSLWLRTYLLSNWDFSVGYFVQQTEEGGYIIAGSIGESFEDYTSQALWVIKTDSLGDTMWTYRQGSDIDNARCVRQLQDSGYIVLANSGLLKLNQEGDTLWTRGYKDGVSVVGTENGEYVFTGKAGTNPLQTINAPQDEIWLFKTTEQGDSVWKRTYNTGYSYYMQETQDKGFVVVGQTYGDVFLVRTDSLGLLGIAENPIVEADNGWNVPHSIGSYIVLHYQGLPQGFQGNVFDVSGRKVDQIQGDGIEGAMTWGINYPPGVYFIQAKDNRNQRKTAKVVLVR